MKCGELVKYLEEFDSEEKVCFLVADIGTRTACIIGNCNLLVGYPAIMLETTEYLPLDDLVEYHPEGHDAE